MAKRRGYAMAKGSGGLRRILALAIASMLLGVGFATAATQAPTEPAVKQVVELNAGCSDPRGFPHCDALDRISEVVSKKTNGTLVIRNHYQALGAEQQLALSVMAGSVDIGNLSSSNTARFSNVYLLYDLPFLFKEYDSLLKSLDGPIGQKLIAQFEKDLGVKFLMPSSFACGRDIQTREKQLKIPADIKGLKIRAVSTPIDLATIKAWGANPTPVDWGQVYTALQQGVVDGENAAISAVEAAKHYEVVKYNLRIDYQSTFNQLFVNAKKFQSLSPDHQKALLEAAAEVKPWHRLHEIERVKGVAQRLGKLGMTIYKPTPEEYAQWAGIREKVWQEVAQQMQGKLDMDVARQLYESQ